MGKPKKSSAIFAELITERSCMLADLPEITCYLDTGYSKMATQGIIEKMYVHGGKAAHMSPKEKEKKRKSLYSWRWGIYLFRWVDAIQDTELLKNPNIKEVSFKTNWNNKLDCLCFTTIRPFNPAKYKAGAIYRIKWSGNKNVGIQGSLL